MTDFAILDCHTRIFFLTFQQSDLSISLEYLSFCGFSFAFPDIGQYNSIPASLLNLADVYTGP